LSALIKIDIFKVFSNYYHFLLFDIIILVNLEKFEALGISERTLKALEKK